MVIQASTMRTLCWLMIVSSVVVVVVRLTEFEFPLDLVVVGCNVVVIGVGFYMLRKTPPQPAG